MKTVVRQESLTEFSINDVGGFVEIRERFECIPVEYESIPLVVKELERIYDNYKSKNTISPTDTPVSC